MVLNRYCKKKKKKKKKKRQYFDSLNVSNITDTSRSGEQGIEGFFTNFLVTF